MEALSGAREPDPDCRPVFAGAACFAFARAAPFTLDDPFAGAASSVFALGPGFRDLKQFSRSASCGMARQCATSSIVAAEGIVGLAIARMNPAIPITPFISAAIRSSPARRAFAITSGIFRALFP